MTKFTEVYAVPASILRFDSPDHDAWYVVAGTKRGNLYTLNHLFDGRDAEDQAERLVRKIRKAGEINLEHWTFWRAIYGTQACLDEQEEAAQWQDMILRGAATEADAPDRIREML